jgi:hypothetical protein
LFVAVFYCAGLGVRLDRVEKGKRERTTHPFALVVGTSWAVVRVRRERRQKRARRGVSLRMNIFALFYLLFVR